MRPVAVLACLVTLVAIGIASAAEPFAAGQTWTYATRPNEAASRVLVLRVEEYPKHGRVIHAAVVGLEFRRAADTKPEPWGARHVPITEAALRRSVGKLEPVPSAVAPAGFAESYQQWKKEADAGKVQYWTLPLRDVVAQLERWIREGRR